MHNAYIVMSRVPKPGKSKTRLIPSLSPEEACRVHVYILKKVSRLVSTLPGKQYLFYTGGTAEEFQGIVPDSFIFQPQLGSDLGVRMDNAFKQAFYEQPDKVIMVGSDIPLLATEHFYQAMAKLEQADVVLGPNYDGGYYLIGMKKHRSEIFLQKNWGTDRVLTNSLQIAEELGLKVELLAHELDIDTYQDIVELVDYLERDEDRKKLWRDTSNFFAALT